MNVKLDLSHLTVDLLDLDLVELSVVHDALATYVETLFPQVAEALAAGTALDDAIEGLDENDAFRIHTIVERLYDKIERPLTILEEEADLQAAEGEDGSRVRIVLESEEEAGLIHRAAKALGEQVGRALEASDLPYPDAERLVQEFASWFDPDDIPEYPYYIEMEVADARIIAQLAERVQAHAPTDQMAQLLKVMSAAAAVETDED
ncbi:MAG TPA: hypothetical protein V6D05_03285 [Stenomitos sp.]